MPRMDKLSNYKTTVSQQDGWMTVVYHSTPIVRFNDAQIKLNTGGWRSVTTKRKMNQASRQFDLGFGVFQNDHDWFVEFRGVTLPFDGETFLIQRQF